MDIEKLTIGEAREIAGLFGGAAAKKECPFEIGKCYFIRCVTYHLTGRLVAVKGDFLVLDRAAWIADTGDRLSDALKKKAFGEVEPFTAPVIVGMGAVVDATEIDFFEESQK